MITTGTNPYCLFLLLMMYPVLATSFPTIFFLRNRPAESNSCYGIKRPNKLPLYASLMPEDEVDPGGSKFIGGKSPSELADGSRTSDQAIAELETKSSVFRFMEVRQVLGMPVQSLVLLNLVAVLWGTQHSVIKMVVGAAERPLDNAVGGGDVVAAFTLARFFIGSLASLPLSISPSVDPPISSNYNATIQNNYTFLQVFETYNNNDKVTWRWGAELGLWMFLGYALQAIGLQYTTASKSGFLLYLNVKFVPFFARIFFGRTISTLTWTSAAAALLGTGLLAFGDSIKDSSIDVNVGDLWSIGAAMSSAMFILRLESALLQVRNSSALSSASLWVVTFFSFLWTLLSSYNTAGDAVSLSEALTSAYNSLTFVIKSHPFSLIYLGGVTTALANYLQTVGQRGITAERASLFYAMDPVYGAFFAFLFLGEHLGFYACVGAVIITVAAATNAFLDFRGETKLK